ncbi:MAG: glycoside hydrolase family 2 TIM barrel-domain containing protein [bacterium]
MNMKIGVSMMAGCLGFSSMAGLAAESPWAGYRFAPDALKEIDLASDTGWTLSIDGGTPRPIMVTAGGWNSDQQTPQIASADVKDHVLYEREISIPAEAKDNVVKIIFGGCNYGAEVFLDDRKIAGHDAPMTPFEADLTGVTEPGKTYRLKVKAYSRSHFGRPPVVTAGFDFNKGMDTVKEYDGHTKYAYGLTGHVRLAIYPAVHISDIFVHPSVSNNTLEIQAWISNSTVLEKRVELAGKLVPWQNGRWRYPSIPGVVVTIPAHETKKVTLGPVKWGLGPGSYWWPNIPFREDYVATLHWLKLEIRERRILKDRVWHKMVQRFGFVEYAEGPYYYIVNGIRFTSFSDSNSYGQVGEYDCWTDTPCFQPPHDSVKGCPETWKRYQRIGFNTMRLSTSVPTSYMLKTADEAGYMLVPEGGSWGNGTCKFHKENFSIQLQGMIKACRNHPCVARYSLANESLPGDFASPNNIWRWLIDAALEVDPTRPCVFEVNNQQTGAVPGMKNGHAHQMEHYRPIVKSGDHIRGMGECAWSTDGMNDFAMQAVKMRMNDWAHFAPWSWLNYWPNFLEGMNTDRHPWKTNNYGDRKDGVDGWGSPIVQAVQWVLHPYLLIDFGLLETNPVIKENSKSGRVGWPYRAPIYSAGAKIERQIEVFNNALTGNKLELNWTAHWDSPAGPVVEQGSVGPVIIEPGFHSTQIVTFKAPEPDREDRTLYLVLESMKEGKVVCRDEHVRFTVTTKMKQNV